MKKLKKLKVEVHYSKLNGFLREFVKKRQTATKEEEQYPGYHPKTTGIGKKDTSFYNGCCNVRFDRKTLPKSGKSIYKSCFIDSVNGINRAWDRDTRALLLVSTKELNMDNLDEVIKQFEEIKNGINK